MDVAVCLDPPGRFGEMLTMVPTAFVRPSLNTMRVPGFRNSGCFMNWKCTNALSPVRKCSLFMVRIVAV